MSEPAKDEAELIERMAEGLHNDYDLNLPEKYRGSFRTVRPPESCDIIVGSVTAVLAAIRAAGWEVAPQTELDALRAENARLRAALTWFVENDDTNEGDTPMPEHGGRSWNEINAYWIEGLNAARAALEWKP
jgi:hypothetical protein